VPEDGKGIPVYTDNQFVLDNLKEDKRFDLSLTKDNVDKEGAKILCY